MVLCFLSLLRLIHRGEKAPIHRLCDFHKGLYCVLSFPARTIPLQRGTGAHVLPVSKAMLLLCQASCCRPVCLCFENMSLVFHHCVHKLGASLLGVISHPRIIYIHAHTRSWEEMFVCFCLLILPPPLKALRGCEMWHLQLFCRLWHNSVLTTLWSLTISLSNEERSKQSVQSRSDCPCVFSEETGDLM